MTFKLLGILSWVVLLSFVPVQDKTEVKAKYLHDLKDVQIVIATPSGEITPLNEDLRKVGLTQEILVSKARRALQDATDTIKINSFSPHILSVRIQSTRGESKKTRNWFAVSANFRLTKLASVNSEHTKKYFAPAILWESSSTWLTTKEKIKKDIVDSIESHIRFFIATHNSR